MNKIITEETLEHKTFLLKMLKNHKDNQSMLFNQIKIIVNNYNSFNELENTVYYPKLKRMLTELENVSKDIKSVENRLNE